MSLWAVFAGSLAARRLANCSTRIWQDTVNHFVLTGTQLELGDSSFILSRIYFIVVFRYYCLHSRGSKRKQEIVEQMTARAIADSVERVWSAQLPHMDFGPKADEIAEEFPEGYQKYKWEVFERCKSAGLIPLRTMETAFHKAIEYYLEEIKDGIEFIRKSDMTGEEVGQIHRILIDHIRAIR